MKRITLITLLGISSVLCFGQVDLRNKVVRQIATGDTITSRIWTGYDTWDGSNPILVNYYDSIAFTGLRGFGVGGPTLLYSTLQVNGCQHLGNALTDTTYIQGRLGINSVGYFSNLSAVGNITTGATHHMFNFVYGKTNKERTDTTKATDTSSVNLKFTRVTGKPLMRLTDELGITYLDFDSTKIFKVGTSAYYGREGATITASPFKVYSATNMGAVIVSAAADAASAGASLSLVQNDNSALSGGNRISLIRFMGAYAAGNNIAIGAAIESFAEGVWAGASDHGANIVFNTIYDGGGASPLERLRITGAGGEVWTPVSQTGITDAGGITAIMLSRNLYYATAAARDISANPQIAAGLDGQFLTIIGSSDVNTLKLDDGNGLQLAGAASFTIGSGDVITLLYSSSLGLWIEVSRSDN